MQKQHIRVEFRILKMPGSFSSEKNDRNILDMHENGVLSQLLRLYLLLFNIRFLSLPFFFVASHRPSNIAFFK